MAKNLEKWIVAQIKHRLSDKHVQMARELGLNPDKLEKLIIINKSLGKFHSMNSLRIST